MQRERSLHAMHSGVHFTQIAPARQINDFVRQLPGEKRDNLFEVMQELDAAGLIRIENDGEIMDPHGAILPSSGEQAVPMRNQLT